MSDPIAPIGFGASGARDIARHLAALRQGGGSGAPAPGVGDDPRRYTIDVGADDGVSFGETLRRLLNETSSAQDRSAETIERFVRGEPVELHQVMAAAEEASIALEMLVALRNKLTDAYRTLVNMQS